MSSLLDCACCMHGASSIVSAAPEHGSVLLRSEGGFFNATLSFPQDYPQSPPTCRFTSEMWHPNGARCFCACMRMGRAADMLGTGMLGTPVPSRGDACKCAEVSRTLLRAVYEDGRVCISILHSPGDDPHGYEKAYERWSPVHTVRAASAMVLLPGWFMVPLSWSASVR